MKPETCSVDVMFARQEAPLFKITIFLMYIHQMSRADVSAEATWNRYWTVADNMLPQTVQVYFRHHSHKHAFTSVSVCSCMLSRAPYSSAHAQQFEEYAQIHVPMIPTQQLSNPAAYRYRIVSSALRPSHTCKSGHGSLLSACITDACAPS